jgi:NAD(P)-dependent dehydrogenase (short-subunit alcohol dehydrogenase family)
MNIAMIWGAGGDIGRSIKDYLLRKGWNVVALGRHLTQLQGATWAFEADFARPAEVREAVYQASQEIDGVNWWIYAAGDILYSPIAEMQPEAWQRIIDANLTGAFLALHYSLPLLSPAAPLYFIGARSERLRLPGISAYAAAKAGLEALAEVARKELHRQVVVARPGAVRTTFWERVPFKTPANAISPEDLADKIWRAYQQGYEGILDL